MTNAADYKKKSDTRTAIIKTLNKWTHRQSFVCDTYPSWRLKNTETYSCNVIFWYKFWKEEIKDLKMIHHSQRIPYSYKSTKVHPIVQLRSITSGHIVISDNLRTATDLCCKDVICCWFYLLSSPVLNEIMWVWRKYFIHLSILSCENPFNLNLCVSLYDKYTYLVKNWLLRNSTELRVSTL